MSPLSRPLLPALACVLAALGAAPLLAHAQGGGQGPPSGLPQEPQPPAPAPAPEPELVVEEPSSRGVLIREGSSGRLLLGGTWYFRQDDAFVGEAEAWQEQEDLVGWSPVRVPHSWNAGDTTLNRSSVGWYRKELMLPRAPDGRRRRWKVRFEGANYRTAVWLNGKLLGRFGGYFPFELDLSGLRRGRNRLVAKVSTLRSSTDLTHWRPAAFNGYGSGGWWNSGGLLREVYVRPVDTIDVEEVRVLPRVRCVRCDSRVEVRLRVRNLSRREREVDLALRVRGRGLNELVRLTPRTLPAGVRSELKTSFVVKRPRLWQPGRPELYSLGVSASIGNRLLSGYGLAFGIRKLERRRDGVVLLNGRRVQLRGASIHEDDRRTGAALTQRTRDGLVRRLKDLGASVTRSHYPLHPAFLEAFDRAGILVWAQAPVYQLPNSFFELDSVRNAAIRAARLTVFHNQNHPSAFAWSLVNEPAGGRAERGLIGPGLARYIRDAAREVRLLDDTRLLAIDRQSRIGEPLSHPAYRHLDALGVNEYFGWYDSVRQDIQRPPSTTDELGPFLDDLHAANRGMALFVTEYGAEGARPGPEAQRGSFEFQRRYALDHLAIHASKPYINGSIAWALRDFRVETSWLGGAPREWSTPPWHNKSLIDESNARKPVYFALRSKWRRTRPLR
ncbi:MAG TPA: glycoside hydrolase family 2 TIM barrel-domain containing protein [Thermoleophilaceae bacterium]|nr:glycoside hydrolase family 2 TIM barrel-domain containing protein [Thermoleophilaceae bacterium]